MFDGSVQIESGSVEGETTLAVRSGAREPWREIDRQLRSAARRRSALDHEELALIREAIACALWRELGMVSMREYLEYVMGYTPGVASERVRVAEALDAMPALESALASNELSYSAVRAITRIATRKTERVWLAACRGKNVQQIEELLAEREPGDRPESPRKPDLRLQEVRMRLRPNVIAMRRQARAMLESEMGERVDDDRLMETVFAAFLRSGGHTAPDADPVATTEERPDDDTGLGAETSRRDQMHARKAPYQIAISLCPSCKVARQNGAGVELAISPASFERAACDARWLGNLDRERAKAAQSVTPAMRERVLARDKHRCRVPGCRSARNLEVHHIVHQEDGGSNDETNLVTICGGHHDAHHDCTLTIRGTADALEVIRMHDDVVGVDDVGAADGDFHGGNAADKLGEIAALCAGATSALTNLGYRKDVAARAVREAMNRDSPHDLEAIIRAALKQCG